MSSCFLAFTPADKARTNASVAREAATADERMRCKARRDMGKSVTGIAGTRASLRKALRLYSVSQSWEGRTVC
jgi:hypothetical protein